MIEGGVLEKSFVCCNCNKTRITIQMLPGRNALVTCRFCNEEYEVLGKNGEILFSEVRWEKRARSCNQVSKLQLDRS